MYVYQQSEPGLYTVGYYNPAGGWMPESDQESREAAARRVHYLNGGKTDTPPAPGETELLALLGAMRANGGHFAARLAEAWTFADGRNRELLWEAFGPMLLNFRAFLPAGRVA